LVMSICAILVPTSFFSGHYLVFFRMVVDGMVGCLQLTWGNLFALFLAPGFLAIAWYVVASVLGWLFATS